jgi:hypothetical protein
MTADGNWNLVVSTPMGERHGSLSLKTEGTTVKGSQMADGNSTEIFDGTINGNEISWKVSITDPMPMTLEFWNGRWGRNCWYGEPGRVWQFLVFRYPQLGEMQLGQC